MAVPSENARAFGLYVTHVDGEGHFLRISGQLDQQAPLMIESLFEAARDSLEKGIGAVPPAAIHEGVICAAKYKDGMYYRAKVTNTKNLATGLVGVHFIDFGNKDIISLSTIRFLDTYDPMFLQLRGQANDYYLSRVVSPNGRWDEPILLKLQSLLCYAEYPTTIDAQTRNLPLISIQFKGNDLSTHLVSIRFGLATTLAKQEVLVQQMTGEVHHVSNWQPILEPPSYTEHVPFFINQNFPSNPASAMRLRQNVTLPFNTSVPPPSIISQRLLVHKASRNVVNLKAPARQPQQPNGSSQVALNGTTQVPPPVIPNKVGSPVLSKPPSPKKSTTYKSRLLEVNSQHKVLVSFAEEGPELFAVQLVSDAKKLQDMMDDINKRPHSSLKEPPMIGTVCLGRMFGDRVICRAIVMNLSGSQCKLFFVDFGDTEMVSYYDIFDIPEEYVKPNVFAMRFCLSGVKKLEKSPQLNETFKQLVNAKVLTLKVVTPEGPPLIQYGELYLDNKNVLDILMANMKDKLQFTWMGMLPLGSRKSVLVSYVDSCIKFYVQLSEKIDELNVVMDAVKAHCENSSAPGDLPVGSACCARFPDDDNWYRARIKDIKGKKVVVAYVDYGNEQEIDISNLRTITPELIKLPAQALKCALKGYENKPVETKTSNQLEMLALEKTLMATEVGVLSSDTMLVSLVDDTVTPPLDIARKMNQLSQPRSTHEPKVTTPVKKDAPDSFSSADSSPQDDTKKKSFRREKSFKEDRRTPRDGNEDFSQRSGSFRGRDNKDGFDRSGPGRHSDKFAGKADRGDRRGGWSKPWEGNNTVTPAPAAKEQGDDREDSPAQPGVQQTTPPRPYNNRRKPREHQNDKGQRPGWKKDATGVGKRLRQAAEAASADAQSGPKAPSIQDRLKRDNKYHQKNDWEEKKNDDWGNKTGRENRPDRRGDRRDNWGDKKDNYQKRDFRDNNSRGERGERHDKPRSNFTPRDRAERSMNSDSDKRSERSYRSQDSGSGERVGRAPPHKTRSKFTQVQCKELTDPVLLTTPFLEPSVELNTQHEVSVTWIISPENFYCQILSLQPKFLEMMHTIPELYKGVRSYTGPVPVGASVLARYPVDGVLYRATVVSIQPFSKFIVRYVDFGNKQLVDAKDIWQLEKQLLELPKMAVYCSLLGVVPKDGEWKANPEIDLCFNAPRYQCVFQECSDEQYRVSLWNNGTSVADMLIEKELAIPSEHQSSVTLKDEAIDLTIIMEQQIMCRVTHVDSYEKFYVQLDLEKADLVEAAIAGFDVAKLTPLIADSLVEGVHCTLKHDGKIYRAILKDVTDTANITAILPDYGNSVTTTLDKLMILPTELSVYYYQSLECCLNNYTSESKPLMTIDEMKKHLTGNKFIIYINSVEGITLVSTLYDSVTGQKVAIFEPDEGAYEQVVQLCMRSVFNYNFGNAYISHLENLNEFYLQKASDVESTIAQLLENLYSFYEEGTPEDMTTFAVDDLCAAKSADGNWYRATIIEVEETQVKVLYPDYGNSETLPKESIKSLDPKFYEPCALALVAGLGLFALQEDAVTKLSEWTADKEVQVTLAFGNDGWLASLHLDGVDLSMKLVEEKLATAQIISNEEKKQEETPEEEEPISLPEGCTQVYISHIDSPGHFWLQIFDKVEKIDKIQAELQANADSYPDIESREMGTWCVAKYSADDLWYRAEILDSDSDITTVRFIDYGNTDVLDNEPGLIKVIPDNLKEIEQFALKSSVNAIPTGTGQWSEPASDYFTQLVGDLSVPVDALIVLTDTLTYVDIYVNGQNLTDKLVSEGHATRSEEPECGDLPSCFASHVNSPSEFWIQLETAAPELQAMETAMVDAENFPELTTKEEGVICAAKYPEDGAWYRAQVIVDGSEGTEVLFMDYGNASITDELRSLPDELKVKPALSRKCALQKPRNIKSWSRKSEIKFNELAAEGATIFNVQFIAAGDISIVELYLEGKSVTEELVGLCEEQPTPERPSPVGQDLLCNAKVCYVNTLDEFYVQLEDCVADLDKVIENLSRAEEFERVSELKVGSICAAFWSTDEHWYRAKILEFCDVGYHVQFIDYGNKAKCEEFRQLPEDLAVIEPMAKCCRLAGLHDDSVLYEIGRNRLDDFATEDTTFQIEFLDSTKEPTLAKISVNGKDFVSMLLDSNTDNLVTDTQDSLIKHTTNDTLITKTNDSLAESETKDDKAETSNVFSDNKSDVEESSHSNEVTEFSQDCEDKVAANNTKDETQKNIENSFNDEAINDMQESELNTSQPDLNESLESNHTVIENKSFQLSSEHDEDISFVDSEKTDAVSSLDKNVSAETVDKSSDTLKTPELKESKDSHITDTEYLCEREDEKSSSKDLHTPKGSKTPEKDFTVTSESGNNGDSLSIGSPAKSISVENSPVKTVSLENSPVKTVFVENSSLKTVSVENSPVKTVSLENSPVKTDSMENSAVETVSMENSSVETFSVENSPVESFSVENSPVESFSGENSPVKIGSVENSPVKTVPVKTDSVENSPEKFLKDNDTLKETTEQIINE